MNWNLNWSTWSDFLAMGGYGLYVWGSFGVTALCMVADALIAIKRHRTARAQTGENS